MSYLRIQNIGKAYKRYHKRWHRMAEWLGMKPRHELRWVLRDISFDVEPGEAVGIVGVNGAGKSTLLKIITGTTRPTSGSVEVGGRISALLELGMGFHPEFTGRQNAYMGAQLRGMTIADVDSKIREIEEFAEISDYFDQPVRVYSSGMQIRLAFAVSTAARPDVLIVDEALSVGDAAFQRKCFQRIEGYRSAGTTLLFVSHDIETVKRLCDKALFIHCGRIEAIGATKNVCDAYEMKLFGKPNKSQVIQKTENMTYFLDPSLASSTIVQQYGDGSAEISEVRLQDESSNTINVIPEGSPFSINYRVTFKEFSRGVNFGMMIKSVDGSCIYGTNTEGQSYPNSFDAGEVANIRFKLKGNLVPGTYYLNVGTTRKGQDKAEFMHRRVDTNIFRVVHTHTHYSMGYANMFVESEVHKSC